MKSFQTKTAVAFLVVAGSIAPAFGQGRGNGEGRDRSARSSQQSRGQVREQASRPQETRPPQASSPRQDFRSGGTQFQNGARQFQNGARQQFEPQRDFRQQEVRQQNNFRGGNSFQQFGSRNGEGDHRSWAERGGYHGNFIPQDRFYSAFGPRNYFRIGRPVFYNGYPRFQYGGYSFLMVDPWPDYWGPDWYDSDDVYIDYQNDGYYMFNRRYPGAGIALDVE